MAVSKNGGLISLMIALVAPFLATAQVSREPATDSHGATVIHETLTSPSRYPLHIELLSIHDAGRNFGGGASVGSALFGVTALRLHSENPARSFFLHLQSTYGHDLSPYAGDIQTTSNIEAEANTAKVYESWWQEKWERFSLLAGMYDLNSEFYVTASSALFLNASFGIGPEFAQTGSNGPSIFPTPGLALRVQAELPLDHFVRAAVFEGEPGKASQPHGTQLHLRHDEDELLVVEGGRQVGEIFKLAAGGWSYTGPRPAQGGYLLGDLKLSDHWQVFARAGAANRESGVRHSLAAGIIYQTAYGLAFTTADRETTLELTYKHEVCPWLSLQPDLQLILNPGQDAAYDHAQVGFVRVIIDLESVD